MSFRSLLNNTAILSRMVTREDGIGGTSREWTTVTSLPCRVTAKSATERAMSGSKGVEVTHNISLEDTTPVLETDRLTIDGQIYEIKAVLHPCNHHYKIEAVERRPNRGS